MPGVATISPHARPVRAHQMAHPLMNLRPQIQGIIKKNLGALRDKHLPRWRQVKADKEPRDKSKDKAVVEELNRLQKAAQSANPAERHRYGSQVSTF
jgi:hypothetical protein